MTNQAGRRLLAFVDESGQRAKTERSSDHFVMGAAVIFAEYLPQLSDFLATLRSDLGRGAGHHLTWKNLKSHEQRLHASRQIGALPWLRTCSVVVCKRHLDSAIVDDDHAYLYTARYLLERLSWLARFQRATLTFTLAAIQRFPISKLRAYEATLQQRDTGIAWNHLDPTGGRIDQPQRFEPLQLADLVTSGTAQAFEPDRFRNVEPRYLQEMSSRIWRGTNPSRPNLTSYGLKMHPWSQATKAAYPWVAAL